METASQLSVLQIILSLAVTDLLVVGSGMLIFWNWAREQSTPPVWVVVSVAIVASLIYFGVTRFLWIQTSEATIVASFPEQAESSLKPSEAGPNVNADFNEARPVVILMIFSIGFWTIPVAYYSYVFLSAFAVYNVDRLTWLGVTTPQMEEFPEARELAVMGDIEGAVERYRMYSGRQNHAVFAAAQLLEADGQYERAAQTFQDAIRLSAEETLTWSKAMYRLAKLREKHLDDEQGAIALLQEITLRTTSSEHGQLASNLLVRLRPTGDSLFKILEKSFEDQPSRIGEDERPAVTLRNPVEDNSNKAKATADDDVEKAPEPDKPTENPGSPQ